MPSCIVKGCKSRSSTKSSKVLQPDVAKAQSHFFTIPKGMLEVWKRAIGRENDDGVQYGLFVCDKHFLASEILWKRELLDADGRVLGVSHYRIPGLKPGTVPSIFSWNKPAENVTLPESLNTPPTSPEDRLRETRSCSTTSFSEQQVRSTPSASSTFPTPPRENSEEILSSSTTSGTDRDCSSTSSAFAPFLASPKASSENDKKDSSKPQEENVTPPLSFQDLLKTKFIIPPGWTCKQQTVGNITTLNFLTTKRIDTDEEHFSVVTTELVIMSDLTVLLYIFGKRQKPEDVPFDLGPIEPIDEVQDLIFSDGGLKLCIGSLLQNELNQVNCNIVEKNIAGIWRHSRCSLWLDDDPITPICKFCKRIKRTITMSLRRAKKNREIKRIRVVLSPKKRALVTKLKTKVQIAEKAMKRAKDSEQKTIQSYQKKLRTAQKSSLEECEKNRNISDNQKVALRQILAAAKVKNAKGRRYEEPWILLCMLLHMRSPTGYKFIHNNEILPVPHIRTIRSYLSKMKMSCGFDPEFFEALRTTLATKNDREKHGILLLDEMSTRESLNVDTQNLTFKGLVDLGEEDEEVKPKLKDKANHALVITFQPLNDTYTQPIAVFASRGPVKGVLLAQLIIKAIHYMEFAGARIHGVVTDGDTTNRKFWTEFGITGELSNCKNSFEHPMDENRQVYVISDAPHLIKTIRNRLYNRRTLQVDPEEPLIEWEHFETLHKADQKFAGPSQKLVCPKITTDHLQLNNSSKMRVRLAVQIFSNSVATELEIFKNKVKELEDCESTITFCRWINRMFDALNRTSNADGLTTGSIDYKIIQESINRLDTWEKHVKEGKIPKSSFLTKQTAEGLRVTLHSTLDIVDYLTEKCDFPFVLTGRLNQDPLEKFFGSIRQAAGSNDHPSMHTFLQIYKILSIYSVLKPPETGNCTVLVKTPHQSLITLAELRIIYRNPEKLSLANTIKAKIDNIIQHDSWDLDEVFDDQSGQPEVYNCMMYYMTAQLTQKVMNTVTCLTCKNALLCPDNFTLPEASLSDALMQGPIIHPNLHLYHFVLFLEESFLKHHESPHLFENILEDVSNYPQLSFPCQEHACRILSQIIQYFVTTRMQEFCRRFNAEQKKLNQEKKKNAKFAKT